ncbi:hypothetical protein [uncultured Porphyromonas sp.]|uniref:hypothetical protein n=1 Tax=uncultured Porphyromonas sp. TaxID=159274 RepID=UPI00260AFBF1|nr:hypothetical protein [uncultured Porphyromonas sp.]
MCIRDSHSSLFNNRFSILRRNRLLKSTERGLRLETHIQRLDNSRTVKNIIITPNL